MFTVLIVTVLAATPPLPDVLPDCLPDITITEMAVGHGNNVVVDANDLMVDVGFLPPADKQGQSPIVTPKANTCPGGVCPSPQQASYPIRQRLFRRFR